MTGNPKLIELNIPLEVSDGWPPVATEALPCSKIGDGYRVEVAPLFVRGLSYGDVISVVKDGNDQVSEWKHVWKSKNTTIWFMRLAQENELEKALGALRALNCNTVAFRQYDYFSVNVPESCSLDDVDACIADLDDSCVAVVFPSLRHDENSE